MSDLRKELCDRHASGELRVEILARLARVRPTTIYYIMNGKTKRPQANNVAAIREALQQLPQYMRQSA